MAIEFSPWGVPMATYGGRISWPRTIARAIDRIGDQAIVRLQGCCDSASFALSRDEKGRQGGTGAQLARRQSRSVQKRRSTFRASLSLPDFPRPDILPRSTFGAE